MKYVDVIGIGAINYDYMFHCKKADSNNPIPDGGREDHGRKEKEVESEIEELYRSGKEPITQIGGSAYLAIKAIKAIDRTLSVSYVGVCGQFKDFDKRYGTNLNINTEFNDIDNKDWLFYTNEQTPEEKRYIGKSVVRLCKHIRENINISAGANDLILDLIKDKEIKENKSFSDFLSQARWIHISSLSSFEQFEEIMSYVKEAKEKNRFLKISIDPGYKYTDEYRDPLQKYLKIADYVFLNEKEYENLIINRDMADNDKCIKLATYFNDLENVNTKVFVIKHKCKHELIDFVNGTPYVYYHKKLWKFKIFNDTGAGDCFAGGFITGVLSDKLISQQPAPIELGALAAKIRMTTPNNDEIYCNIQTETSDFFQKKYKNGRNSIRQKIFFCIKTGLNPVLTFLGGAILTLILDAVSSILF